MISLLPIPQPAQRPRQAVAALVAATLLLAAPPGSADEPPPSVLRGKRPPTLLRPDGPPPEPTPPSPEEEARDAERRRNEVAIERTVRLLADEDDETLWGAVGAAYDLGYDAGVGMPLMVVGTIYTLGGIGTFAAGANADDDSGMPIGASVLVTAVGLGQLVPGAIFLADGRTSHPTEPHARRAYEAGYTRGWGACLAGYGGVFAAAGLAGLANIGESKAYAIPGSIGLALGGTLLGFGIDAMVRGAERWRNVRRGLRPDPDVGPRAAPTTP